jgi:hypothetical protein
VLNTAASLLRLYFSTARSLRVMRARPRLWSSTAFFDLLLRNAASLFEGPNSTHCLNKTCSFAATSEPAVHLVL